jgi:tetratricopeptide (TPR) repeat protein
VRDRRPAAALWLPFVLVIAQPSGAQTPDEFADALVAFVSATAGTHGDEGPDVTAALEGMDRALAAWDGEILRAEARLTADASRATPQRAAQMYTDIAAVYLTRGRFDDARDALARAVQQDPRSASAFARLGALHDAASRPADAQEMYRRSWALDPSDPATAYLLWLHRAHLDPHTVEQLVDGLSIWYQRLPARTGANARTPFPETSFLRDDATASPVLPPARYADGFARLQRGQFTEALALFRRRARADPLVTGAAAADAPMRRAIAALRAGRVREAQDGLRDALGRLGAASEVHRVLGLAYWADYRSSDAIDQLRRAIGLQPDDERARLTLARVLVGDDRLVEAEALLADTVALLPDSASAHWWLGTVYTSLNRTADARRVFERAAALPILTGRGGLLAAIGRLHEIHADFDGAIRTLTARVRANLNDAQAHLDLAHAYTRLDSHDDAFVEYAAALLIDPRVPAAHIGIGQVHLAAGRFDRAVIALERAVALQPRSPEARYALALALRGARREEESASHLTAFNQLQTQAVEERRRAMTLGVLKEEAASRTAEGAHAAAAALWERIVQVQPNAAAHHAALAAALAADGRLEAAVARYEHAAGLGGDPSLLHELSALYARLGRTQDSLRARDRYEQALLKALGTPGPSR